MAVMAILLLVTLGSLSLWELYNAGREEPEEVTELTLEGRLSLPEGSGCKRPSLDHSFGAPFSLSNSPEVARNRFWEEERIGVRTG